MRIISSLFFLLWIAVGFSQDFAMQPHLHAAGTSSLTIQWQVETDDTIAIAHYGTNTDADDHQISIHPQSGELVLHNLEPATIYYFYIQVGTVQSEKIPFITRSESPGDIKVYFNFPVAEQFSDGSTPETTSPSAMETAMIQALLGASHTIDVCIYNVNRDGYINALKQASANGVQVRYIAEEDNSNYSLHNTTLNFPVLYVSNTGIMHNKFFIIDKDYPHKAKVILGSLNPTSSNTFESYNNMVTITDQSLAKVYTTEFEELWGSTGALPNASLSKSGVEKSDNTPHTVFVQDTKIETFFSPSDRPSLRISDAIATADDDVRFSLLAFTNDEIEAAILGSSVPVKGLIENQYSGTAITAFQNAGKDVFYFFHEDYFLHHKYGLIDAANPDSDPQVITGSHNWTYSAETKNDENTVIIHDASIANIFLQEFEARWQTIVAIDEGQNGVQLSIFPNPTCDYLIIDNQSVLSQNIQLKEATGRAIIRQAIAPNEQIQINVLHLPAGIYYLQATNGRQVLSEKITIFR